MKTGKSNSQKIIHLSELHFWNSNQKKWKNFTLSFSEIGPCFNNQLEKQV